MRNLKCNWCDAKRQKEDAKKGIDVKAEKERYLTINKEVDSYVQDKSGKYYHEQCYKDKLKNGRKKYDDNEIDLIVNEMKERIKEKVRNDIARDRFYEWVKNRYKTVLPVYYVLRIDSITKGEDIKKQVYGKITYDEFLEMYEKMSLYLTKQTMNIKFKNTTQRMNYELAIVLGQYENYKNYKERIELEEKIKKDIEEKIKDTIKFNEVSNKVREKDSDDLYISDIINELI